MTNESVVLRNVGLNEYRKTNIFYPSTKLENFENSSKNYYKIYFTISIKVERVILFGACTKW